MRSAKLSERQVNEGGKYTVNMASEVRLTVIYRLRLRKQCLPKCSINLQSTLRVKIVHCQDNLLLRGLNQQLMQHGGECQKQFWVMYRENY